MLAIWPHICREAGIEQVLINLHAYAVRQFLGQRDHGVQIHIVENHRCLAVRAPCGESLLGDRRRVLLGLLC